VNTGRDKSEFPVSKRKIIFIFQKVLSNLIWRIMSFSLINVSLLGEGTSFRCYVGSRKGQDVVLVVYADGIAKKYLVAITHNCIATSPKVRLPLVDNLFHEHVWVSV